MEPPVKAGALLLQQPAGLLLGAKRWKKSWFALYPASPHGVARLEFFDCKEGAVPADRVGTKRLDKKIVRLADCVSVIPVPECSLRDGLSVFRLETSDRTYVLAAEPQEAADWVGKLCKTAFLPNPGKAVQAAAENVGERDVEMAPNTIYSSREEVNEFWVTVQKTEAAERCKLQGVYLLKASQNGLILRESHAALPLYTWPYRLLRRYGRDKVMFSFEAGRRCESGPGNFTFETKAGNEIFHVVEAAIQVQKAQVEENRQSSSSLEMEAPGILHLQSAMAVNSLSLEGEGQMPERWPVKSAVAAKPWVPVEKEPVVPRGQSLRDWLGQRPGPPAWCLGELPGRSGHSSPLPVMDNIVYAEPLDAVKGAQLKPDSLYADPVDSQREEDRSLADEQTRLAVASGGHSLPSSSLHIYDEPEGRAPKPAPGPAAIYDEAHFPCEAWRTQGVESPAGYELPCLPGTGDYAVPVFHRKARLKPPTPCPALKPPRTHQKPSQLEASRPGVAPASGLEELQNTNNSNNGGAMYSHVLKHPPSPLGQEQSVDGSGLASVYEDLGEI